MILKDKCFWVGVVVGAGAVWFLRNYQASHNE